MSDLYGCRVLGAESLTGGAGYGAELARIFRAIDADLASLGFPPLFADRAGRDTAGLVFFGASTGLVANVAAWAILFLFAQHFQHVSRVGRIGIFVGRGVFHDVPLDKTLIPSGPVPVYARSWASMRTWTQRAAVYAVNFEAEGVMEVFEVGGVDHYQSPATCASQTTNAMQHIPNTAMAK